ncbi:MAG: stage II sporulation protein P [Wujia sp.]
MVRLSDKIVYFISAVFLLFVLFVATCYEGIGKILFNTVKCELIPFCSQKGEEDKLIYEFIPMLYSVNKNDSTEYWQNNGSSQVETTYTELKNTAETATATDVCDSQSPDETSATTEGSVPATVPPINASIMYSEEQLFDFDFLVSNCYTVAASTSVNQDELNARELLSMDMTIDTTGEGYKVLIYHTHGSEGFVDSREGVVEDTVIGLGDELTRILTEEYGIKTYHDRTAYDMVNGKLDRSNAYTYSGEAVDKILAENPSIQVIIDLHRDGVNQNIHLVKLVDGKPTAQIMFLNGVSRTNASGDLEYLYNPYKKENLSFGLKLHLAGKSLYGDLMRKNYISGYCFNLDRLPRATLVEVGAQTNTVEEAKNAMVPLAAIINAVLTGN